MRKATLLTIIFVIVLSSLSFASGNVMTTLPQAIPFPPAPHDGPMPLCYNRPGHPCPPDPGVALNNPYVVEEPSAKRKFDLLLADAPPVGQPPPGKCCYETKYGPYCCN